MHNSRLGVAIGQVLVPRYHRAPASDDPLVREARQRAWRDREAGTGVADWPVERRELWKTDRKGFTELLREYNLALDPGDLYAPLSWRDEFVALAAATALYAATPAAQNWRAELLFAVLTMFLSKPLDEFRAAGRQRSARRLRLTPDKTPRASFPTLMPAFFAGHFAYWLYRRARGIARPAKQSSPVHLASLLVYAFNERRSWRRAYRG